MTNQIIIDTTTIKPKLLNILNKLNAFYLGLNQELTLFWRKFLAKQSANWFTNALLVLINNPATALFLNTVLMAGVAQIFGGTIAAILFYVMGLNIVVFCANVLGWAGKLEKK